MAKTTADMITENMVKDILQVLNGRVLSGLGRLIFHTVSDKQKIKAYRAKLEK